MEASAFAEQEKQTKYLDAFKNGKLHTNVSAVEFAEKKGVVKISKFTEKKQCLRKVRSQKK